MGRVASSSAQTTSGSLPTRPPRFTVGGDPQEFANAYFSGVIDEVAVYDRALGQEEILRHLSAGRGM